MNTCPCFTDLPVTKKSYASCDKNACGKSPYMKPVGEFTKNFDLKCDELSGTSDSLVFDPARFKLKPNVPMGQLVTFTVDVKFPGSNLVGGNHLSNVPVYANVQFGRLNSESDSTFGSSNPGQLYDLQLIYNQYVSNSVGSYAFLSKAGASLFVKKGTQIFAGVLPA